MHLDILQFQGHIVTLKPGLWSLKCIETDAYRSATYDFLLTFHSKYGPIPRTVSETDGDFSRKSQKFPTPCILRPCWAEGVPLYLELGIGHGAGDQKKL